MAEQKKDNDGCSKVGVIILILLVLSFWGLLGKVDGKSFFEGIGDSVSALIYLIVIGVFGYAILNSFNK
jgi:hypothetical protein